MLNNYNFNTIKEPARKAIMIEAFRLCMCDMLYHVRRARSYSFEGHGLNYMLKADYGLDKTLPENDRCPFDELYRLDLGDLEKKIMDLLMCTSEYGKKDG